MKKVFKWIGIAVITPFLLMIILAVLLYLPPVQNWAVKKVAAIASEKTGMEITVEHVCLEFPLNLGLEGFRALHPNDSLPNVTDTIADIGKMVVDVRLWPLLDKQIISAAQNAILNQQEVNLDFAVKNGYEDTPEHRKVVERVYRRECSMIIESTPVYKRLAELESEGGRTDDMICAELKISYPALLKMRKCMSVLNINEHEAKKADAEAAAVETDKAQAKAVVESSDMTELTDEQLFLCLRDLIENEQLFLKPDFGRQTLIEHTGLSKERIGAAFAQGSDSVSLPAYVRELRLDYAVRLMNDQPDIAVELVSQASGFANADTFTRNFRAKYGMTPTTYKQTLNSDK